MSKIIQLSTHLSNLIAAGEVVERPASVIKELIENAVDAGATQITVEIQNGGMTFMRITDNGCGMDSQDARSAFLRHATSKLKTAEDLSSIGTMGFRGEALAAIASVSRIDLITKTANAISGTSLHLEAGTITDESEAGCPDGTTIIVRDLFFNTPARMKFMKSDTVEGGKVAAAVQLQALAHPEIAIRFLRDGKEILSTPGNGDLETATYSVYGRECADMIKVNSSWEGYHLAGYISRPSHARPSRALQTFFVNNRPVRSRILITALEEAYRNQIMSGKFPACVLHLDLPTNAVDVNVHPAKTEVKFLNEKAAFDCIHYGVLGALNQSTDRPAVTFPKVPQKEMPKLAETRQAPAKQENFFRTMNAEEYRAFSETVKTAPKPSIKAAAITAAAVERTSFAQLREPAITPVVPQKSTPAPNPAPSLPKQQEPEQAELIMPEVAPWRIVGELYHCYILVEQGDEAFLIDKHAAHERILFEKLKENPQDVPSQTLLTPLPCHLSPDTAALLLANKPLLEDLGFDIESFGTNTILIRQIPMDIASEAAIDTLETLAEDIANGRRETKITMRDQMLHTIACKSAIKAGWHTDDVELTVLVKQVMSRQDLKHCPHGRPICISLSKKHLEKQFKRS